MVFLLWLSIISFILVVLCIKKFDILSPSFLSGCVFFIACTAYLLRQSVWETELSLEAYFLILLSLNSMFLGENFIGLFRHKRKEYKLSYIRVSKIAIYADFFIGILVCFIYWRYIRTLALQSGVSSGNVLWDARLSLLEGNSAGSIFINILKTVIIMFSIFCIYIFINNYTYQKNSDKKIDNFYNLLPLLPSTVLIVLDTGRTEFVRLFSVTFVCYMFFLLSYGNSYGIKNLNKLIKKALIFMSLLVLVFWMVGKISNKNGSYTLLNNLAKYIGSGLGALSEGISNTSVDNRVFGLNTFRGIRQTLSIFFDIETSRNVLSFVRFNDGEMTNIYTALYEYYTDYGFLGTVVIYFFKGVFLTWLYQKAKEYGESIWALMYVFYSYAIFRQITASDFLSTYFGTTHIIAFFTLYVAYRLLVKREN